MGQSRRGSRSCCFDRGVARCGRCVGGESRAAVLHSEGQPLTWDLGLGDQEAAEHVPDLRGAVTRPNTAAPLMTSPWSGATGPRGGLTAGVC